MLTRLRVAVSFLTILPVSPPQDLIKSEDLAGSTPFFPLAGWIIGIFLMSAAWLADSAGITPLCIAVILVGLEAWLTRGLHLDGLADVMDGFGGGFDRERRLAIMKDSSIGAFGAVGLILVLFFKVAGLEAFLAAQPLTICPGFGFFLILLPPVAARWAMAILAYKSSYPRQAGTAGAIVGNVRFADLFFGGVLILPLLVAGWLPVIAVVAAVLLPSFWLRKKAHSLLGGVTGDVLGASCELGEAAGWLVLPLVMRM